MPASIHPLTSSMPHRLARRLLVLALLISLGLTVIPAASRSVAQEPSLSVAGMVVQTRENRLWVWNPDRVFARIPGTGTLAELRTASGASLANVRAVVEAADTMWIMQPDHVYRRKPGTLAVEEVLTPAGLPITNARGVAGAPSCPLTIIWTPAKVFAWDEAHAKTLELLSGTSSTPGMLGVVPMCPNGAWLWTSTALWRWDKGSQQLIEITTSEGTAIGGVNSIVVDPDDGVWIVAAAKIFRWTRGPASAVEVLDVSSLGLAGVNTLIGGTTESSVSPLDDDRTIGVWLAAGAHLYRHVIGTRHAAEMRSPAGAAVSGVRGMVVVEPTPFASPRGEFLVWNADGIFAAIPRTDRVRPIADSSGAAIADVDGVVAFPTAASTPVLFWNSAGLFRYTAGMPMADEIRSTTGAALSDIRGVIPVETSVDSRTTAWIWTASSVYALREGMWRAAEVRRVNGLALSNVWGIVTNGDTAWLRTNDGLYEMESGSTIAHELRTVEGGSLAAPAGGILALVTHPQRASHNYYQAGAGPWGASLVNPPLPLAVTLAGSLRGSVPTQPTGSSSDLTTLTVFSDATLMVHDDEASSVLRGAAALLLSPSSGILPYRLFLPLILSNS